MGAPNKGGTVRHDRIYIYDGKRQRPRARVVMEKHLGRKLGSNEAVHHINGNPMDDRVENLAVMSRSAHTSLHARRQRKTLNSERLTMIRELREQGLGARRIATALGVSLGTVSHYIYRYKIDRGQPPTSAA